MFRLNIVPQYYTDLSGNSVGNILQRIVVPRWWGEVSIKRCLKFGVQMDLPKFIYYPDPIKNGSIAASDEICECCSQSRGYISDLGMYCRENVEKICPWCIASGAAAEKFDGTFNELDWNYLKSHKVLNSVQDEITKRTPGFGSIQEQWWAFHCNDGCEFHGRATSGDFREISEQEAERICKDSFFTPEIIEEIKQNENTSDETIFFKFVCRHCGEVIFNMDLP